MLLCLKDVSDFLGVSTKTVSKMIKEKNLPVSSIGREWRVLEEDLIDWIRLGYQEEYRLAYERAKKKEVTTRNRGQLNMEEYGVVVNEEGSRRVVEGAEYIPFRLTGKVGNESLVGIYYRGSCSFQQTVTEAAL